MVVNQIIVLALLQIQNTTSVFARSALSIRAVHLILMSGLLLRSPIIIDLYEGDQKAASLLLSTGGLRS